MGEWSANKQDRAKAVWDKLLGYFGDGLLRKFDAEPPDEWVEVISELNDFQIRRGFKRLAFSWRGGVPNLPDFVRFCITIGDDAPGEGPAQRMPAPAIKGPELDGWDISGNMRFRRYITHRLTQDTRAWGVPCTAEQAECTRIAVRYKNAWAQDMRESTTLQPDTGEVIQPPVTQQRRQFVDCMQRAESDIRAYRTRAAA